ncbi:MAG TPA: hypothetical protein VGE07_00365 [Herpetosiphonaceae bacterium]
MRLKMVSIVLRALAESAGSESRGQLSRFRQRLAGELRQFLGRVPPLRDSPAPLWCRIRRQLGIVQPNAAVLAAVRARDTRRAGALLLSRGFRLHVEQLPGGPFWIIAQLWNGRRRYPDQEPLRAALAALAAETRLALHGGAFWHLAAREWWDAGRYDELDRRLLGSLTRYDSIGYLYWGRRLAMLGHPDAGMYLLLSGLYEADEAPLVERFKHRCRRMTAGQVASSLPKPALWRQSRYYCFPDRVFADLADTPAPAWLKRRPRRP